MSQFWKTQKFKALNKFWNKKLKASGLLDHETELNEDRALKQRATNCYRQASLLERKTRLEYYTALGYLAQSTIFPTEIEKVVMTKHSEGKTIKEIVNDLQYIGILRDRRSIGHIIKRWQTKWGVRIWNHSQMNLKKTSIPSSSTTVIIYRKTLKISS